MVFGSLDKFLSIFHYSQLLGQNTTTDADCESASVQLS